MALIDARDRFAARREEARQTDGKFGEQAHSAPELTLVAEPEPQTLDEILEEMNELGELDDDGAQAILDAPIVDTFTGTPEEQENAARNRELNDVLTQAGIDRASLTEKTLGEIQNGLLREAENRKFRAAYEARQAEISIEEPPFKTGDSEIDGAVEAIVEARGYKVAEYGNSGLQYMSQWAQEERAAGRLTASMLAEVARSKSEREEDEKATHLGQIANLGTDTDAAYEEALEEHRLRGLQKIRNLRPKTYVNLKDTNALIRADLKQFAGAKFSVRGDSYSGGASTHVNYVDGPPLDEVEPVAKAFSGASFDGMTDLKSYHSVASFDPDGIPVSVHYAADFVFVNREFSDDVKRDAEAFLVQAFAAEGKTFDPNERNTSHELPQAFYQRATEENGGIRKGGFGFSFRGNEHYSNELVHMASSMLANERWAAAQK